MNKYLSLFFLCLTIAMPSCESKKESLATRDNYTVIISLDGSRWDYADYFDMPFFDYLEEEGVKARMEPSFPSSTFPNHYAMATGLVPDHNGLVNNTFWNPDTGHEYSISDNESRYDPRYYLGEPVWVTAQRQGVKTGIIYWVGSDIPICGTYPTYYRKWDKKPHWNFSKRTDEVVRLLSLPEAQRPRLIMAYFDEPDHQGHVFGPMSVENKLMAQQMDSLMNSLYLRIKELPIGDKVNFILVGDHGMTDISKDRFINWYSVVPREWIDRIIGSNPTSIWVKDAYKEKLYKRLSKVEHIRVWKHGEVPEYLNYGTSDRLGDLIVCPDLGWQFNFAPSGNQGTHGYDPRETDMMIAFRAIGPDFKEGYEAPFVSGEKSAFKNVDLYPLLCELLGIEPAPVDGKLERIEKILR